MITSSKNWQIRVHPSTATVHLETRSIAMPFTKMNGISRCHRAICCMPNYGYSLVDYTAVCLLLNLFNHNPVALCHCLFKAWMIPH